MPFILYIEHLWTAKWSWKIFLGGPVKSWKSLQLFCQ